MTTDHIPTHTEIDPTEDSVTEQAEVIEVIQAPDPIAAPEATSSYVDPHSAVDLTKLNNPTLIMPGAKLLLSDAMKLYDAANTELRDKIVKQPKGKNVYDENHPDVIALATMQVFLSNVVANTYCREEFVNWFENKDVDFQQSVNGENGKKIRVAYPNEESPTGETISGKPALHQISRLVNYGRDTVIPCWASGVHIEVSDFQPYEMLELDIRIAAVNVDLGNNTKGTVYSGDDAHVSGIILDFIKSHITKTNVKDWQNIDIFDLLKVTDIPSLFIGALAGIYPGGYPLIHYCTNRNDDDIKCTYVYEAQKNAEGQYLPDGLLNFNKTVITDMARIDKRSVSHMSQPMNTFIVENITAYQSNLYSSWAINDNVEYHSSDGTKIKVVFKVPTINEYLQRGMQWIAAITDMVDNTLSTDSNIGADDREIKRRNLINRYAGMATLIKQLCWVSHIVLYDDTGKSQKITDDKTITRTLNSLTANKQFKAEFNKTLTKYKEECTVTMTGYSNFTCPSCKKSQIPVGSKYPTLIPINPIGFFFTIIQSESKYSEMEIT